MDRGGLDTMPPLTVLIVGDTLEALVSAAAFHSHGNNVELFSSRYGYNTDCKALIQITPNAHDALQRLGISIPCDAATPVSCITEYSESSEELEKLSMEDDGKMWQRPWIVMEEKRLRQILIESLSPGDDGKARVTIQLEAIEDIDIKATKVALIDGTHVSGDVIVGADGVNSYVRTKMELDHEDSKKGIVSLTQFQAGREDLSRCLGIAQLLEGSPGIVKFNYSKSRMALVPRPDEPTYDVTCFHPAGNNSPNTSASERGASFEEGDLVVRLTEIAVPGTVSMRDLPRASLLFTREGTKSALIGSAAFSVAPIFGADASNAIEDAAALVAVLSTEGSQDAIQERLALYSNTRYDRASAVQQFSYVATACSQDTHLDFSQHLNRIFSHNAYDHAVQRVRDHHWLSNKNIYWRMPIEFGPIPGPRQRHDGQLFESQHAKFRSASIRFKTSRSLLENLLPPGRKGFRLRSPGTVAYASFAQHTFSDLDWLGGGGYSLLGFYIHGVEYVKPNGEKFYGTHVPVLFESLADPILSGREELGMPKLYTAIDSHRRSNGLRANASWQGAAWGNFAWTGLQEVDPSAAPPPATEPEDGLLCWRYMPGVGKQSSGSPDADYPILIPAKDESCQPSLKRVWKAESASVRLDKMDWDALPTMHHIVARLQELPILQVIDARVVEGNGVPSALGARGIL